MRTFKARSRTLRGCKPKQFQTKIATVYFYESVKKLSHQLVDEDELLHMMLSGADTLEPIVEIAAIQLYIGGNPLCGCGMFKHNATTKNNGRVLMGDTFELTKLPSNLYSVQSMDTTYGPSSDLVEEDSDRFAERHALPDMVKITMSQNKLLYAVTKRIFNYLETKCGAGPLCGEFIYVFNSSWVPFLACARGILLNDPPSDTMMRRDKLFFFSDTSPALSYGLHRLGVPASAMMMNGTMDVGSQLRVNTATNASSGINTPSITPSHAEDHGKYSHPHSSSASKGGSFAIKINAAASNAESQDHALPAANREKAVPNTTDVVSTIQRNIRTGSVVTTPAAAAHDSAIPGKTSEELNIQAPIPGLKPTGIKYEQDVAVMLQHLAELPASQRKLGHPASPTKLDGTRLHMGPPEKKSTSLMNTLGGRPRSASSAILTYHSERRKSQTLNYPVSQNDDGQVIKAQALQNEVKPNHYKHSYLLPTERSKLQLNQLDVHKIAPSGHHRAPHYVGDMINQFVVSHDKYNHRHIDHKGSGFKQYTATGAGGITLGMVDASARLYHNVLRGDGHLDEILELKTRRPISAPHALGPAHAQAASTLKKAQRSGNHEHHTEADLKILKLLAASKHHQQQLAASGVERKLPRQGTRYCYGVYCALFKDYDKDLLADKEHVLHTLQQNAEPEDVESQQLFLNRIKAKNRLEGKYEDVLSEKYNTGASTKLSNTTSRRPSSANSITRNDGRTSLVGREREAAASRKSDFEFLEHPTNIVRGNDGEMYYENKGKYHAMYCQCELAYKSILLAKQESICLDNSVYKERLQELNSTSNSAILMNTATPSDVKPMVRIPGVLFGGLPTSPNRRSSVMSRNSPTKVDGQTNNTSTKIFFPESCEFNLNSSQNAPAVDSHFTNKPTTLLIQQQLLQEEIVMMAAKQEHADRDQVLSILAKKHITHVAEECTKRMKVIDDDAHQNDIPEGIAGTFQILHNMKLNDKSASLNGTSNNSRSQVTNMNPDNCRTLSDMYRNMIYNDVATSTKPSRLYDPVPVCDMCFRYYTLLDYYRESLILKDKNSFHEDEVDVAEKDQANAKVNPYPYDPIITRDDDLLYSEQSESGFADTHAHLQHGDLQIDENGHGSEECPTTDYSMINYYYTDAHLTKQDDRSENPTPIQSDTDVNIVLEKPAHSVPGNSEDVSNGKHRDTNQTTPYSDRFRKRLANMDRDRGHVIPSRQGRSSVIRKSPTPVSKPLQLQSGIQEDSSVEGDDASEEGHSNSERLGESHGSSARDTNKMFGGMDGSVDTSVDIELKKTHPIVFGDGSGSRHRSDVAPPQNGPSRRSSVVSVHKLGEQPQTLDQLAETDRIERRQRRSRRNRTTSDASSSSSPRKSSITSSPRDTHRSVDRKASGAMTMYSAKNEEMQKVREDTHRILLRGVNVKTSRGGLHTWAQLLSNKALGVCPEPQEEAHQYRYQPQVDRKAPLSPSKQHAQTHLMDKIHNENYSGNGDANGRSRLQMSRPKSASDIGLKKKPFRPLPMPDRPSSYKYQSHHRLEPTRQPRVVSRGDSGLKRPSSSSGLMRVSTSEAQLKSKNRCGSQKIEKNARSEKNSKLVPDKNIILNRDSEHVSTIHHDSQIARGAIPSEEVLFYEDNGPNDDDEIDAKIYEAIAQQFTPAPMFKCAVPLEPISIPHRHSFHSNIQNSNDISVPCTNSSTNAVLNGIPIRRGPSEPGLDLTQYAHSPFELSMPPVYPPQP